LTEGDISKIKIRSAATSRAGTYFWVDPKEEIVGAYMTQAPSPIRACYRRMFKALVYQPVD
jgi:hypothetical protein